MNQLEENITQRPLEEVLPEAFLGYSKYVILHRAIPDVRDGLKPVHRRIIYAMNELGMYPDKPYSKSARLVGHVMGAYHPHGDSAIYESVVRMAQPWASRYPFVDGHGNFGSVDGDPAAAMRYTEVRMTPLAQLMCEDLEKNTVTFRPNYDNRLKEPAVLPSPIPNILINGTGGIAVGLATNMPPHNLREVINGIIQQIDNPDISLEELMQYIPGPDFPTGGYIVGREGIREAYATGRGKLIVRGKVNILPGKSGRHLIVITEIPYQVNKANLAAKIEALTEDKIDGIYEVRDESDREGMRLVVETKKDADPHQVLKLLYKYTQLQETFGIINLVIDAGGIPKVMGLKEIIAAYIEHRKNVVINRTRFDLGKARARAHVLEGLVKAIDQLDAVIDLIRASKNPAEARWGLMAKFEFSEVQAQAILDMKLQHLTNLEIEAIQKEYDQILKLIEKLEGILADINKVYGIIKKELQAIADKYGDERRTQIIDEEDQLVFTARDEVENPILVTLTQEGFIKQVPLQGGQRSKPALTCVFRDGDYLKRCLECTDKDTLYFFTDKGNVYSVAAKVLPAGTAKEKGKALVNILPIPETERVAAVLPVKEFREDLFFVFVTKWGQVLRTPVADFANIRSPQAMGLNEGDEVIEVLVSDGTKELLLISEQGQVIRFEEAEINPMGRKSKGVIGMKLDPADRVKAALLIEDDQLDLVTVTEKGFVKKTGLCEYKLQARAGKGVAVAKIDPNKTGNICGAVIVSESDSLVLAQAGGNCMAFEARALEREGRAKTGRPVVPVVLDDNVVQVLKV